MFKALEKFLFGDTTPLNVPDDYYKVMDCRGEFPRYKHFSRDYVYGKCCNEIQKYDFCRECGSPIHKTEFVWANKTYSGIQD